MEPFIYGTNEDASTNDLINQNGDYLTTWLNLPLILCRSAFLQSTHYARQKCLSYCTAQRNLREGRASSKVAPTMDDLKHERRAELTYEWTDRLQDLKRWGDYAKINVPS